MNTGRRTYWSKNQKAQFLKVGGECLVHECVAENILYVLYSASRFILTYQNLLAVQDGLRLHILIQHSAEENR